MDAPRTPELAPLFADSPAEQFRGGWQHATATTGNGHSTPRPPLDPKSPDVVARTPAWHWWALLLITVFGGVIRFAWLDQPALWGDEAMTFMRVCGSFEDLLDELSRTRFMPLHYQLYWLIGQAGSGTPTETLTPFMMRLVPAIAGTLMTPAMYFLARQLVSRRAALLTALFTACSAYLFVYARDAKMYMHFWLFVTLNMACFLWWLRTKSLTGWLGWMVAGSVACGLHLTAIGPIAIQPIMLLTQRRAHWAHGPMFVLGLGLLLAGPLGYYFEFNRFGKEIEEDGWRSTGITWVEDRNKGYGAAALTADSAAAYLFAYNYILESVGGRIPEQVWTAAVVTLGGIVTFCLVGALPWSRGLRGARFDDPPAEPWWRSTLWLGVWIALPTVAVAYLSFPVATRIGPDDVLRGAGDWLSRPWLRDQPRQHVGPFAGLAVLESRAFFVVAAGVLFAAMTLLWRYIPRMLAGLLGYALVLGLGLAYLKFGSLLPLVVPTEAAHVRARDVGLLVLLILLPPLLWYFAGTTLRERFAKAGILLMLALAFMGLWWALDAGVSKPLDGNVWMPRYLAFVWPAVAVAVCALLVRLPTRPLRYAAIAAVLGVNLVQAGGRVLAGNEPPLDRVAADILADHRGDDVLTFTPPLATDQHFRHSAAPGSQAVLIGRWPQVTPPARYYLLRGAGVDVDPETFRRYDVFGRIGLRPAGLPGMIAAETKRHAAATRVVVWQQLLLSAPPEQGDALGRALGPEWSLADERSHAVRFYWSWSDLYTYRRREYVKMPAPPATQSAADIGSR